MSALLLTAGLSQATAIQWYRTNDVKAYADQAAGDLVYTGVVTDVEFQDGMLTDFDAIVGKYTLIDLNLNKFYIATSADPLVVPSSILLSGDFNFDITIASLDPNAAGNYSLSNLIVNNSIGSAALAEFGDITALYPSAVYDFSIIGSVGNGQIATVPEPGTLGLMGLGLLGLGAAAYRRRKA